MKLAWLKNRLSVMGPGEILFRVERLVSTRYEWFKHQYKIGSVHAPQLKAAHSLLDDSIALQDSRVASLAFNKSNVSEAVTQATSESAAKPIQLFYQQPALVHTDINWSEDPKTGRVAPHSFGKLIDYRDDQLVGDIKYLWELGRHQFLIPLAIDVFASEDKTAEQALSMYLQTWLDQNPVDTGIHWCSGLEAALRLIAWSFVHSILLGAGKKNGIFDLVSDPKGLEKSIFCQVRFIQSHYSRHSSANNHLIGELTGVWVACNVFEFSEHTQAWRDKAQTELETEANLQNHVDGVNREQAIYYHLWVLEYLLLAWLIGQRFNRPFSSAFVDTVGRMAGFLQNMCATNGSPANIGDADGGQVARFTHELSENPYADLLQTITGDSHASAADTTPYNKAFWYNAIVNPEQEKDALRRIADLAAKQALPLQFNSGGYCLMGDESLKACLKAGPMGYRSTAAHGHADLLSVCVAVDDLWWLSDQGTYSYHSDAQWRDYFRGTCAHNTVEIASENQSEIGGVFLWLDKASASMSALVKSPLQSVSAQLHSVTQSGVSHSRTLQFDSTIRTVSICDELEMDEAATPTSVKIRFHFHPLVVLEKVDNQGYLASMHGREEKLNIKLSGDMTWELLKGQTEPTIEGWYSEGYDHKVPSSVLVGTTQLSSSRIFNSSIATV